MTRRQGRVLKTELQFNPERLRLKIKTSEDGVFWATYFGRDENQDEVLASKDDISVGDIINFDVELAGRDNDVINIREVQIEESVPLSDVKEIEKIGAYDKEDDEVEKIKHLIREIKSLNEKLDNLEKEEEALTGAESVEYLVDKYIKKIEEDEEFALGHKRAGLRDFKKWMKKKYGDINEH